MHTHILRSVGWMLLEMAYAAAKLRKAGKIPARLLRRPRAMVMRESARVGDASFRLRGDGLAEITCVVDEHHACVMLALAGAGLRTHDLTSGPDCGCETRHLFVQLEAAARQADDALNPPVRIVVDVDLSPT